MRAVTFDVTVPRYLLAKSAGRFTNSAIFGSASGVRMTDQDAPTLPGPDWVRLRVILGGICGTDLGNLRYSASPAMEPFGSFPAVLGHEILARVEDVGANVNNLATGQRVTVDPILACWTRGYGTDAWCRSCGEGRHATCENAGEEGPLRLGDRALSRGLTIGYHRDLPGGWGEQLVAHQSQVFPVDDALDDRTAVLMEPLSIGMHAVLNTHSHPDEPVFVIGSGPIAFAVIWALRAVGFGGTIVSQAKREHEARLARALGASQVVTPGEQARDALIHTGSMAYQPIVGPEVYSGGGFPLIFDCVGSQHTLTQALRYASPRGRVVMLGCAAEVKKLDLTFTWARELRIEGFVGYGKELFRGVTQHTFQVTHDLLLEGRAPVQRMVTHVFPLDQYKDALRAADDRRSSGSVKVLLSP